MTKKYTPTNLHPGYGPGDYEHNVQCWMCDDDKPAVYDTSKNCFVPCWECQKNFIGIWTAKTFRQKILELFD